MMAGAGIKRKSRIGARGGIAALLLLEAGIVASAQRPSFHHYDTTDGLAHNRVNTTYQDSKGYLWFGTWEGLSRFDGDRFLNYGTRDGLPNPLVNAITEDHQGRLWVGTWGGGLARLRDDPMEAASLPKDSQGTTAGKKFVSYRVSDSEESNEVSELLIDADDNIWCVAVDGLYRASSSSANELKFEVVIASRYARAAFADSKG